jgi:hypothetical protein
MTLPGQIGPLGLSPKSYFKQVGFYICSYDRLIVRTASTRVGSILTARVIIRCLPMKLSFVINFLMITAKKVILKLIDIFLRLPHIKRYAIHFIPENKNLNCLQ